MVQSYRDLLVWQKGIELVLAVYTVTEPFPGSERFGLTSQTRRAAVSIASNVAEGKAIGGQSYARHVRIALGSEAELQTQLEIAKRLDLLNEENADRVIAQAAEVGRMLTGLLKALRT